MMQALEGINVLDVSGAGPGPFCTMMLGDLGADVVRVEAPPAAGQRQASIGRSGADKREALFQVINRNKRSVVLNLKTAKGLKILYRLAEKADVMVEAFRPGVAKRLKIDYPTLSAINPNIVYCSVSGYGQDGPYALLAGHDLNYISVSGTLDLIGEKGRQPVPPLNIVADFGGGGMSAAVGILSALIARGKTGRGQYLDISCTDASLTLMPRLTSDYFLNGVVPRRGEFLYVGGYPHTAVYETGDGKYITIACIEPLFWENLCKAIGKEEYIPYRAETEHFTRPPKGRMWGKIRADLKRIFLTRARDEWFDLLSKENVPIAKVYSLDEVFTDPQILHRRMVVEVEHPEGKIRQVGIAVKMSDTPGSVRRLPPVLGEHTGEVLASLGYSQSEISALRGEGVIS